MFKVIDGLIVSKKLPKTGTLKDGTTVSGYHLLPIETLTDEGWLPYEDIKPSYDLETEYIIEDGYEILEDKVKRKYRVEIIIIPEEVVPEPTGIEILNNKLQVMSDISDFHEELIVELATEIYK